MTDRCDRRPCCCLVALQAGNSDFIDRYVSSASVPNAEMLRTRSLATPAIKRSLLWHQANTEARLIVQVTVCSPPRNRARVTVTAMAMGDHMRRSVAHVNLSGQVGMGRAQDPLPTAAEAADESESVDSLAAYRLVKTASLSEARPSGSD